MAKEQKDTPEVRTLALGEMKSGKACVLWLTSRGQQVVSRELVYVGEKERAQEAWLHAAYLHLWLRKAWGDDERAEAAAETRAHRPEDVHFAHGFCLHRVKTTYAVCEVEAEERTVTKQEVHDCGTDFNFAWERLDIAAHRMLRLPARKVAA